MVLRSRRHKGHTAHLKQGWTLLNYRTKYLGRAQGMLLRLEVRLVFSSFEHT